MCQQLKSKIGKVEPAISSPQQCLNYYNRSYYTGALKCDDNNNIIIILWVRAQDTTIVAQFVY